MSRILRIYTLTLAHIAVAVLQDLYLWKKNNDVFFLFVCLFFYSHEEPLACCCRSVSLLFRPPYCSVLNRVGSHHLMRSGWKCCMRKYLRFASCYYCRLRGPTTSAVTQPLNTPGKGFPRCWKS